MFADASLAAEIDLSEGQLCAEIAQAAAVRRPEARGFVKTVSGGIVAFCGPGAPCNKAIGIGFREALDEAELAALESEWRERGEPMRIELSTLALGEIAPFLTSRGYRLMGFENVLGMPLDQVGGPATVKDLTMQVVDSHGEAIWSECMVEGFATPDLVPGQTEEYPREILQEVFADLASSKGFLRYVARFNGKVCAAASMRIAGTIAQLCGATTLPAFRRRGVQTALLQRRLEDARSFGCKLAVITTQPGSKSQQNSQLRGFDLLYARAILIRQWS